MDSTRCRGRRPSAVWDHATVVRQITVAGVGISQRADQVTGSRWSRARWSILRTCLDELVQAGFAGMKPAVGAEAWQPMHSNCPSASRCGMVKKPRPAAAGTMA